MESEDTLRTRLRRIDGRGYKAYQELRGSYRLGEIELFIDRIQADPFAAPSRARLRVPAAIAEIPPELRANRTRGIALRDWFARRTRDAMTEPRGRELRRGSGGSGRLEIDAGGQEVLERSAIRLAPDFVEARIQVGLPAAGRRVLARVAEQLLCDALPDVAEAGLCFAAFRADRVRDFVACVENQEALRGQLAERGLVAFLADGSLLPRESGASDRPLARGTVPLRSPESLRVECELPHPPGGGFAESGAPRHTVSGLGIPRGVTLIVGGGYHGKSTLLRAVERGVYPHIPGDGREVVVTDPSAVKIRAEDGRRVEGVDIGSYIADLPLGRSTDHFGSDDASGSTSQAANTVEALEAGCRVLLFDEDTCATNFMTRDARMQALVAAEREPIIPFVDRVRELYEEHGVSSVLVMGSSGDYFEAADTVIAMDSFEPRDCSAAAKQIAATALQSRDRDARRPLRPLRHRAPRPDSLDPSRGRRDIRIEAKGVDRLVFGGEDIDLRSVEQLVDSSQTRAAGFALALLQRRWMDGVVTVAELLDRLEELIDGEGLDVLDLRGGGGRHPGNYARPRRYEVAAALNRLRTLRVSPIASDGAPRTGVEGAPPTAAAGKSLSLP